MYSSTWSEHLLVHEVLEWLRGANLTGKPRKCQFGMTECAFLGHIVGCGKMRPHPDKLAAVVSFAIPGKVRTFLGLTVYYRNLFPTTPLLPRL